MSVRASGWMCTPARCPRRRSMGRPGRWFKPRLTPSHAEVLEWIGRRPGRCAVVYESGPTGFGLARALRAAGWRCEVAASSKLAPPGWRSGEDRRAGRAASGSAVAAG